MKEREYCEVLVSQFGEKIIMYKDGIADRQHEIEGDLYINHNKKEVRIFNFPKVDLTNYEKLKILYGILKETFLFPKYLFSKSSKFGNVASYTLLINGYLLDGSFKEQGKKYKTIIEEFIELDGNGQLEEINILRDKIDYFYKGYQKYYGKEEVNLFVHKNSSIKGFIEYLNFSRLFAAYLASKEIKFRIIISRKIFNKEGKIIVLPY